MPSRTNRLLPLVALLGLHPMVSSAQEITVYAVDLYGKPKPGVQLRLNGETQESGDYGRATFQIPDGTTTVTVEVGGGAFVGRSKTLTLSPERLQSGAGFVIPLWTARQVKTFADKVVKNPDHYAVALRSPEEPTDRPIIVAKYRGNGDVDSWIRDVAPNLPTVRMPQLARSLYHDVAVGADIPNTFNGQLAELDAEITRQGWQNRATQPPGPNYPYYNYRAPWYGWGPMVNPRRIDW